MSKPSDALEQQIEFLLHEARNGTINIHQLMRLIDMAYSDYLDFHPLEKEIYYDSKSQRQDPYTNS